MSEDAHQDPAGTRADSAIKQWSEEMSVGNVALDDDHKTFFDFAKILADLDPAKDNQLMLLSALNMLEDYVAGHFLREEKALRAVNYPHLEEHLQKHNAFRQHVLKIINAYRTGNPEGVNDLPNLVVNWLSQHIMREDMRYKYWIKDKFVDNRPLAFLAVEAETKG
jgi:hemerythrin